MKLYSIKIRAQHLRSQGRTYSEISDILGVIISKSTLSSWCSKVKLPEEYYLKMKNMNKLHLEKSRIMALEKKKEDRLVLVEKLNSQNNSLINFFKTSKDSRKITLAVLYLAEGSKSPRGALMFGNSDPSIIGLFMRLMRECYEIDESKFRITVQCRADQDVESLENIWSKITAVSRSQFYKARIDKRTIGKKSRKADYRGVCRVDYFSSSIDLELKHIAKMLLM